jgi:fumarylacetoacetase
MASFTTWVPDVEPDSSFSLANIPFGIATTLNDSSPHAVTAIGCHILDLKVLLEQPEAESVFPCLKGHEHVFSSPSLNAFADLGRHVHSQVRSTIQDLLSLDTKHPEFLKDKTALREKALLPVSNVKMCLPMQIGDYTDFYAGYHHAFGVGSMWRGPANALQPNYTHLPVGYHGRSSSIVVSGHPVRRPVGQIVVDPTAEPKQPAVKPSQKLDIELELGCFIARGNEMGTSIDVNKAEEHIFGYVLLNDWSARDIQNWEYVPLGPFNGKNFATTISPWVIMPEALEPFRSKGIDLDGRPELQDYLKEEKADGFFDIKCEIDLTSELSYPAPVPASSRTDSNSSRGRHFHHIQSINEESSLVVPSDACPPHLGRLSHADR